MDNYSLHGKEALDLLFTQTLTLLVFIQQLAVYKLPFSKYVKIMLLTITICYRPSFGYTDRVIIDLAMITNCLIDSKTVY